eukprot:1543358-Pleurochrysis_carterae.AAC.1
MRASEWTRSAVVCIDGYFCEGCIRHVLGSKDMALLLAQTRSKCVYLSVCNVPLRTARSAWPYLFAFMSSPIRSRASSALC